MHTFSRPTSQCPHHAASLSTYNIQRSFQLCIRRSTTLGMVCRSALRHRHKRGETKRPVYVVGLPFARSVASNCPPVPLKATLDYGQPHLGGHSCIDGCEHPEAIHGCSVNGRRRTRIRASGRRLRSIRISGSSISWKSGAGRDDHQGHRHAADRRRRRRR
jgi:hypothetical protein